MMEGKFDLEDMFAQMEQFNKMGSMSKLLKFIPGMPKISQDDLSKGEKEMKRVKAVIQSMTIEERRHPEILKASRKIRIAKGCAMQVSDVNTVATVCPTMADSAVMNLDRAGAIYFNATNLNLFSFTEDTVFAQVVFNVNEGVNVSTFEDFRNTLIAADYDGRPVNIIIRY